MSQEGDARHLHISFYITRVFGMTSLSRSQRYLEGDVTIINEIDGLITIQLNMSYAVWDNSYPKK